MNVNDTQLRMLKALSARGVLSIRSFTDARISQGDAIPTWHANRFAADLERKGLIERIGDDLYITVRGRQIAEQRVEVCGERYTPSGTYTGVRWNLRAGAEDHKRFPSRGF